MTRYTDASLFLAERERSERIVEEIQWNVGRRRRRVSASFSSVCIWRWCIWAYSRSSVRSEKNEMCSKKQSKMRWAQIMRAHNLWYEWIYIEAQNRSPVDGGGKYLSRARHRVYLVCLLSFRSNFISSSRFFKRHYTCVTKDGTKKYSQTAYRKLRLCRLFS